MSRPLIAAQANANAEDADVKTEWAYEITYEDSQYPEVTVFDTRQDMEDDLLRTRLNLKPRTVRILQRTVTTSPWTPA